MNGIIQLILLLELDPYYMKVKNSDDSTPSVPEEFSYTALGQGFDLTSANVISEDRPRVNGI